MKTLKLPEKVIIGVACAHDADGRVIFRRVRGRAAGALTLEASPGDHAVSAGMNLLVQCVCAPHPGGWIYFRGCRYQIVGVTARCDMEGKIAAYNCRIL